MSPIPIPLPLPSPLDSSGGGSGGIGNVDGVGGMGSQMGTISLGMLIQYTNQKTYSDLLNLAEILPRKSDLEKKIDIVQFAQRTRQLYVRLLALVKWAASASKVDKCCHIMAFLEKQNTLFTDSADKLFHMTKENLIHARLPHFHIPAAVETLTTGSYDRLPLTIRQRILPPEPITATERKQTLTRLEQIVQHRLLTSDLPVRMRTSMIENGRVRFTVDYEFEVSLTLMSESISEPWRLLEIDILVDDKESGEGKPLVHSMQVGFIHQLIQSRLQDNPAPFHEVYFVLHSFCQALQLQALYVQTLKLLEERLNYHIRIEEYLQGKSLSITYWRELTHKDPSSHIGYRVTVQVDPLEPTNPLIVLHTPSLGSQELEVAETSVRTDSLSIECLLVHTIYIRTKSRLTELKQEIDALLGSDSEKCHLSGSPATLLVPIVQPSLRSEQLLVTVDTHTGVLLSHIPQYEDCSFINDLQNVLNQDKVKLEDMLSKLRYWLMVRRTEKTLQHLAATAHEALPLLYDSGHPLEFLSKFKVYVTFHRHPSYVLIVEFCEKKGNPCELEHNLFLLVVKEASIEDNPNDDSVQVNVPKSYLRAYRLLPLDSFIFIHGPSTKVDIMEPGERALGGKRKLQQKTEMASKLVKVPAYFLADVAQVIAYCDQMFPLSHLSHQLEEEKIVTSGVQVEEGGFGVLFRLLDMPSTKNIPPSTVSTLRKHLLSASVRVSIQQHKGPKLFIIEYVFTNCPVSSVNPKEQEPVPATATTSISVVSGPGVSCVKTLDDLVHVQSFNYRSISLSYGSAHKAFASVRYDSDKTQFVLNFGMNGNSLLSTNAHSLLSCQLEEVLNNNGSNGLVYLSVLLYQTYQPMNALSKLSTCIVDKRRYSAQTFTLVPHSATRLRVAYRNYYCLEIDLLPDFLVTIRDGVFSHFGLSNIIEEFTPIQGFKAFLSKYAEENFASRRRSQSEDDNPPTPIPHEESPWPTPKSSSPARHGPITPPVSSNPHTPASPHPAGVGQTSAHGNYNASPAGGSGTFSLASPPSMLSMNPSPATVMSHSSPAGGFLGGNSPSGQPLSASSPGFMTTPSPGVAGGLSSQSPASALMPGMSTRVSRSVPQKPYAAAVPTVLTHDAFHTLCLSPQEEDRSSPKKVSILERFLGSTFLKNYFTQSFKNRGQVFSEPSMFQLESLILSFTLQTTPLYSLVLKVQPSPNFVEGWKQDELQTIEAFFASRVAVPPYKQSVADTFIYILLFPYKILKDFVWLMQIELMSTVQLQAQQFKWSIHLCLLVPPHSQPLVPVGKCGIILNNNRTLFYVMLIRAGGPSDTDPNLVLPILYDASTNKISFPRRNEVMATDPIYRLTQIAKDIANHVPLNPQEICIYPTVRRILQNLSIGQDSMVYPPSVVPQQTGQSQVTVSSRGSGISPAMSSPHTPSSMGNSISSVPPSTISGVPYSGVTGGHIPGGMNTMVVGSSQPMMSLQGSVPSPLGIQQQMSGMMQGGPRSMQSNQPGLQNMQGMQGNFGGTMINQFPR